MRQGQPVASASPAAYGQPLDRPSFSEPSAPCYQGVTGVGSSSISAAQWRPPAARVPGLNPLPPITVARAGATPLNTGTARRKPSCTELEQLQAIQEGLARKGGGSQDEDFSA